VYFTYIRLFLRQVPFAFEPTSSLTSFFTITTRGWSFIAHMDHVS